MGMGARLKELRVAKGESLQQTADVVGTSKAHLWQIERGKAVNPSAGVLRKLADHFSVKIGFLVGEDMTAADADQELAAMFRQAGEFEESEREILRGMMKTLAAASERRKSANK